MYQRRVGMKCFDVLEVMAGIGRRMAAVFAHVQLISTDLVAERMIVSVDLALMRFKTAALRKGFLALIAFEWTDTYSSRSIGRS